MPSGKDRLLTHDGLTLSMAGWGRRLGITRASMRRRYEQGLRGERLFAPKGTFAKPLRTFQGVPHVELERRTGISRKTIAARILRGRAADEVLAQERLGCRRPKIGNYTCSRCGKPGHNARSHASSGR